MTEMEPAPPVGFNLTFVCPEGQVFDHDWWENIANAQQIQGWVFLCFCQTNYCKCFTQHQNQHQWQLQQVLSCHSHMGPMCSLRLNSHQSCPNNISKWGQTMHDLTQVLKRWEKIKYSNYFNSGLRHPLSRSLVRTPVLLILLSGTDSIVFFVS